MNMSFVSRRPADGSSSIDVGHVLAGSHITSTLLKDTVLKNLFSPQRCPVNFTSACHQSKVGSEFIGQTCWTVPDDSEPTASHRSFQRECRHTHISLTSQCVTDGFYIPATLFRLREEMKHGSVMPRVIEGRRQLDRGEIGLDPDDCGSPRTQSLPGKPKPGSSHIEYGNVLIAFREELINERGGPSPPRR